MQWESSGSFAEQKLVFLATTGNTLLFQNDPRRVDKNTEQGRRDDQIYRGIRVCLLDISQTDDWEYDYRKADDRLKV